MRISDWSSDVCSSDLVQPGGPHPGHGLGRQVRRLLGKAFRARGQGLHFGAHVDGLHLIADAGGVGAEALVLTLPARQPDPQPLLRVVTALLVRRAQRYGRAGVRERWWQYVIIRGFADLIKKKK